MKYRGMFKVANRAGVAVGAIEPVVDKSMRQVSSAGMQLIEQFDLMGRGVRDSACRGDRSSLAFQAFPGPSGQVSSILCNANISNIHDVGHAGFFGYPPRQVQSADRRR